MIVTILLLVWCLALPGTAFADVPFSFPKPDVDLVASAENNTPTTIKEVKPIAPEELVEGAEKVGGNLVALGQGLAPVAVVIGLILAVLLIFIGLPLIGVTKWFFRTGMLMLFCVVMLYVLVNHAPGIIGFIKGILGVA